MDLVIHNKTNYLESGKRDPKRYYIVPRRELIALIASQIKTASDTLKQQLETIAVIALFERLSLFIAQDWTQIKWNFNQFS